MYKVNLSRVFRQLFVDPLDLDLLCLYWNGTDFSDFRVPFRNRNESMFLIPFTSYIQNVERCNNFTIMNCVDDLGLENIDKIKIFLINTFNFFFLY